MEVAGVLSDRLLTAEEAARLIQPGQRVFVGSACATPRTLVRALEELPVPTPGVILVHGLTDRVGIGDPPRTAYRHRVFYNGGDVRDLADSGMVDYVPISLADVPDLFTNGHLPLDVALVQVAPPDEDGTCSLGVSVDITRAAVMAATTVIAEVNPAMPRTRGNSRIPVDRIDHMVEVDTPVTEYVHEPITGAGEKIARYVARLVDDHATIQVGLGRVPHEMLRHLHHRRDLSVHSDVITDAVVDLVDAGVVTGPVVGSWAMGTRRRTLRGSGETASGGGAWGTEYRFRSRIATAVCLFAGGAHRAIHVCFTVIQPFGSSSMVADHCLSDLLVRQHLLNSFIERHFVGLARQARLLHYLSQLCLQLRNSFREVRVTD